MTKRWDDYFAKELHSRPSLASLAVEHWLYHQRFYQYAQQLLPSGSRVLEIGCGYGFSAWYLAARGYQVTGMDDDENVLQRAKSFREGALGLGYDLEWGDVRSVGTYHGRFDFVFSAGLLEHFDLETMKELLAEQARCAPMVGLIVPSRYTPASTDEHFYSLRELSALMKGLGLQVRRSFGYGLPDQGKWMQYCLPEALALRVQDRFSLAMNLCIIAQRVH